MNRLAFVALVACNNATSVTDAGIDAATDSQGEDVAVSFCGPTDAGYEASAMMPPKAPGAAACNAQQATDYATCHAGISPTACQALEVGDAGACLSCIESQSTDPRWGVVVETGANAVFNLEGCLDDALGQVSLEKANGGAGSCGERLFALYGCEAAACTACQGAAHDACSVAAIGVCAAYDALVESSSGPCAALVGDAPPAAAQSCLPNTNISDPTAQQVDWIARMVTYMCGP